MTDVELKWVEAADLAVEGRGFPDAAPYERLPQSAKGSVPEAVWDQAQFSSGLAVRFVTDSPALNVRWRLRFDQRPRPAPGLTGFLKNHQHWLVDSMVGTHQSGLDLYRRHAGGWLWQCAPQPVNFPNPEAALGLPVTGRPAEWMLYLPAFNGVDSVQLAVKPGFTLEPGPPRPEPRRRPVVFYGTSIVHGAVALRPGMTMPAIVGRRLDWPVVNFAFCGSAQGEAVMAELMARIDAAAFVVDPIPNMWPPALVAERLPVFVRILRKAHPGTPIVLAEGNVCDPVGRDPAIPAWSIFDGHNKVVAEIVETLRRNGDRNIHVFDGRNLFGGEGEGSCDGVHPTDLGLLRMAEKYVPLLRRILPADRT